MFGGTFNPPHLGHLLCASAAADELGLDEVLIVPTRTPPHKLVADEPGPEVRLALVQAALRDDPRLTASDIEIRREGPSYTVDTLTEIRAVDPGAEVVLIVGGDMAVSLPTWHRPQEIVRLAALAVAERGAVDRDAIAESIASLGAADVTYFPMIRFDLSSTVVRDRVAAGWPNDYLVPRAVIDEIEARGLYRLS